MNVNYYTYSAEDALNADEVELYYLIMEYRASLGLPSVPLSKSLTIVAARHAVDIAENVGNLTHAWSDAPYDSGDSSTYGNMWYAPQRLGTPYTGYGFEISAASYYNTIDDGSITPKEALDSWKSSPPHHIVIINEAPWTTHWNAIGVGIYKGVAQVWFGWDIDPAGPPDFEDGVHVPGDPDLLTGTPGIDVVTIPYVSTQVDVALVGNDLVLTHPGGTTRLVDIERLEFVDGTLAFDFEANAGQAYRLYQAAFDRVPDTEGLSYWIGRLDSGETSLNAVAESFLHSPEFVRTYGTEETVSNSQFVELLYLHTLGRGYDQSGLDYWVERLDGGHTNRADLLAFFSESDENVARVAPAIQDGIWFA